MATIFGKAVDRSPLWLKLNVGLLFTLMLLNTMALMSAMTLGNKVRYLVMDSGDRLAAARLEKDMPVLVQGFVKETLVTLFYYSKTPEDAFGVKPDETYLFNNFKVWVPNAIATYNLSDSLQGAFIKGILTQVHYPKIKQLNAEKAVLRIDQITQPQSLEGGYWELKLASGIFYFDDKGQLLDSDPYFVNIKVQEVEPPTKPLGMRSNYDSALFMSRQAGLAIVDIRQISEFKP